MIKNLKFRTNATIALKNSKSRRSRWAIPLLAFATGGIYAALQLEPGADDNVSVASGQTLSLPLALPHAPDTADVSAPPAEREQGREQAVSIIQTPVKAPTIPAPREIAGNQMPVITPAIPTPIEIASIQAPPETVAVIQAPAETISVIPTPAEMAVPLQLPEELAPITTQQTAPDPTEPAETPQSRWLTHEIKSGDSLARIFNQFGLPAKLLHRIVNCSKSAKQLNRIRPGQILRIELDSEDKFTQLRYEIDPVKTLRIARDGEGLIAELEEKDIEQRNAEVSGIIESSLFLSAQRAGLSNALTLKLAEIFGWDIDFALEIRSGDRFSVVYEEEWLDGQKLKDGNIMAAEFVNRGKVYRAVRYKGPDGKEDYYTPDGKRMRKTFLRTPVKFSRISSKFTKRRWHPVLKKWRSHKGVDYAAPRGTAVKAAGDGKVTFVGRKGGYGKTIFIQHEGIYTTVYGHLNGYAKGIRKGKRISQGQLIGYVGSTGLASGPHLHYEFRINGKHRNPLKVTFAPAAPLKKKYLPAFQKATQPLLAKLDNLNSTLVADAL